ncbi:MAG TPA: DUF5916 domain-containing protein [Acidobacteriota bacterium]|nr:DUF5916 domain-containing protein [Acidobacteriota bacterium]
MTSRLTHRHWLPACLLMLAVCHFLSRPAMAGDTFTPVYHPTLDVSKAAGEIKIDGKLGDPGWRNAARAANFAEHRPGDQTEPPVQTVAYMTYDDENLYVSFVCYDDPRAVRASLSERERVGNDDNICLCLDTYGDAAWAYTLNVNPYGVQADALWSPDNGEDGRFDLVWESAGLITDSGYQVEMAVPFASLRFPSVEQQVWRVDFWRNHPREASRAYSWAAYDRNEACWPCKWGTVTGIEGVQAGRGVEIMPSAIGYQYGALNGDGIPAKPYEFADDDAKGEMSLGGKYAVSSDVTVEATYNPDFSQVEADAGQISVNTTFALFYPERRPFFQEGSDLFRTVFNSFYTRTVNDPQFAAKVTARTGRSGLGYLIARDENSPITLPFEERSVYLLTGRSTTSVFRLRQTIGSGSQLGLIATDRRFDGGGSGSVISHDGLLRFTPSLSLSYQAVLAHTKEANDSTIVPSWLRSTVFWDDHTADFDGESYWGHGGVGVLRWQTRTWNAAVNYWEVSPTYRADNGYDPKNNRRDLTVTTGYRYRPESDLFDMVNPWVDAGTVWNWNGRKKDEFVALNLFTQLRVAQASSFTQYIRRAENLGGIQFDNIWNVHQEGNVRLGDQLAIGLDGGYGHTIARRFRRMGKTINLGVQADIKPYDRILVEQWAQYATADEMDSGVELYRQFIYRNRFGYQLLRQLSLRLVVEYENYRELGSDKSDRWSVDPLLTYRINPFSIFYIGSTYNYETRSEMDSYGISTASNRLTSRQFFMKLQYLFQI